MDRKGLSLVEVLIAALILSFLVAATAAVYQVGERQQRTARAYSIAQSDIRRALQRVTRTLRHGYRVVATGGSGTFSGQSSGAGQVIVEVPEPGGATRAQIRVYRDANGNLYVQRQDQAAPGTALMTGVDALEFRYWQTDPGTGSAAEVAPASATEVEVRVTARREPAVTTVRAYVSLRNAIGASI